MDVESYILIGGRSLRLGPDKAFVNLGGETLAMRASRTVSIALGTNRISFISASSVQFGADLIDKLAYPIIADIKPGFGAWSGLSTALTSAQAEWILVLACDLPMVSVEFLRLMADLADNDSDAVVPRQQDERLQPLCAIYRVKPARTAVEKIFTDKQPLPKVNTIFDNMKTRVIGMGEYSFLPDAEKLFLNINTAADLAAYDEISSAKEALEL